VTTKNFTVKNGLTIGVANIDATTGNANLGNLVTSGQANLASLVVPGTSNLGSVGNITITGGTSGYYLQTNGSGGLSWQPISVGTALQNGNSNVTVTANSNVNTSVAGVANVFVVTSTGVNVAGTLNATGNANTGNIGATFGVFTNVSGNGSTLSSINGANVTGTVANATYATSAGSATSATTAGTVTTNAQPNITSVGTLTSLAVTGNTTSNNFVASTTNIVTSNAVTIPSGTAVVYASQQGGRTYISYDMNTYPSLYEARFVNIGTSTNVPTGATGDGYWFGMGAGDVASRGYDLFGTSGNQFFARSRENGNAGWIQLASNVSGTVLTASTVTTNAQPNITSATNLTSIGALGSLTVTGNATVGNLIGPHANGNSNVSIPVANGNINLTAGGNVTLVVTPTNVSVTGSTATVIADSAATADSVLILEVKNGTQNLGVMANASAGSYNPLVGVNDITLVGSNNSTGGEGNVNISIVPWSTGSGGIRIITTSNVTTGINLVASTTTITGVANVTGNLNGSNIAAANGTFATITGTTLSFTTVSGTTVNAATLTGVLTTNAQPNITSVGTLTSLSVTGNANVGNLGTTGQLISTVATGTAPLVVSSTTQVNNLNSQYLNGFTWAIPAGIGTTTPNSGSFTTLTTSGLTTHNANVAMGNNYITSPIFSCYKEYVSAITISGSTQTLDLSTTNIFNITLTANTTLSFINPPAAGIAYSFMIYCKQYNVGGNTITWPSSVKFPNGSTPSLTTTQNYIDILNFFTLDGGVTYIGALSLANVA